MKIWIIIILIALLLIFSSCAVHRPSAPAAASSEEAYDFHLSEGRLALRESHSGKALVVKPNSARAHNLLGIACFQQKDYKQTKAQCEKAVELNPTYAQAYNNLGGAYFRL